MRHFATVAQARGEKIGVIPKGTDVLLLIDQLLLHESPLVVKWHAS